MGIHAADPKSLRAQWTDFLRRKSLKTTHQREAIVDIFLRTKGHVSVDELLADVRKKHPKVGYATVYRTLRLLSDSGLAASRQFGDGHTRYEVGGDTEHHDHLICEQCGYIIEFHNEELERLQDQIADDLGGFSVQRHRHELYGLCPKAQGIPGGYCPGESASRPRAGARSRTRT